MSLPALIDAATLQQHLDDENILIVDLSCDDNYMQGHIAGAVHIGPMQLICGLAPAPGKLPTLEQLTTLLANIGYEKHKHIVAYDDAGGCWAGRLIWTLTLLGHQNASLLDGGRNAWLSAGLPLTIEIPTIHKNAELALTLDTHFIIDKEEILQRLGDSDFAVWDTRTAEEYRGEMPEQVRGGHIPGAVHLEWTRLMDDKQYLLPLAQIQSMLDDAGLSKDKIIATHCQTHRRSGLTWFVAHKLLAYPAIKAYPGSWSDWASDANTPIEK